MNHLIETGIIVRTLVGRLADLHGADNAAGYLEHLARCLRRQADPRTIAAPSSRPLRASAFEQNRRSPFDSSIFVCSYEGLPGTW